MTTECTDCLSGFVASLMAPFTSGSTPASTLKKQNELNTGSLKLPGLPELPKLIDPAHVADQQRERVSLLNNPIAVKGGGYIQPAVLPCAHTVYVPPLSFALSPAPVVSSAK